jgi:hypothetical protein
VSLKGFVADEKELGEELGKQRVFASPMLASTGLNTKNLLALEHGLPLVTTPLGVEGMHLDLDGGSTTTAVVAAVAVAVAVEQKRKKGLVEEEEVKDVRGDNWSAQGKVVGVAEDAEGFALALAKVYEDRALWQARAEAGTAHLKAHFSAEAQQSALASLLAEMGD